MSITHKKVSSVPDAGDTSLVRPSDWNDEHDFNIGIVTTLLAYIDGGGEEITTGIKGDVPVDFDCLILEVKVFGDQVGDLVVDIWADAYADFPPTDADSITGSSPPTLSSEDKSSDNTLTGWTTALSAGDVLRFNVDSVTGIQRACIALTVQRVIEDE